jgi:cytochrome c oxidase subunit II
MAAVVGLGLVLAGCASNAPQDTLKPAGPFSHKINTLFQPVFWIAVAVFVVVEGLIVFAVFRFREKSEHDAPRQVHGNTRLEITLTVLPALLLGVIAVPTVGTILDLARKPPGRPLTVDVIGHRWWWEYRYEGSGVVTATELHIPIDRPVYLKMTSVDVIHSFWIPKLNGKRDVIPGRVQTSKVEAVTPGVYLGQCTEFCGASHANMRNRAIAQTETDFQRWLHDQQQAAATPPTGTAASDGLGLFEVKGCAGCHTIKGVSQGMVGPNLTHVYGRTTFAGGIFHMSPENLAIWLRNPPGEKPGSKMPNLHLKEDEIAKLVAYLETLK